MAIINQYDQYETVPRALFDPRRILASKQRPFRPWPSGRSSTPSSVSNNTPNCTENWLQHGNLFFLETIYTRPWNLFQRLLFFQSSSDRLKQLACPNQVILQNLSWFWWESFTTHSGSDNKGSRVIFSGVLNNSVSVASNLPRIISYLVQFKQQL